MARSIAGKTALITGAGKRLGRAIALALARDGVNVAAHYHHSQQDAESLVEACRALGVNAWAVSGNLENPEESGMLVDRTITIAGSIDILVNNASIFPSDRLTDFTAESLALNMRVNAFSPAQLARTFAARVDRGDIVNLLDARMNDYDREHLSYHLSKRALFALTRMMAIEFAPRIRVNAVAPGLVLPPDGQGPGYLESLAHTNPLQTFGAAEDVTEALMFLLKSGFTTGQVVYCDGGRHMLGGLYG